jgi:hypothetical protein
VLCGIGPRYPTAIGPGTLLNYRLRLHGPAAPAWLPDSLADADRDLGTALRFSDTQVSGPHSLWEHTHVFEPDGEGLHNPRPCPLRHPLRPLGELAHMLFVRRNLERTFDFGRDAFATHFATT